MKCSLAANLKEKNMWSEDDYLVFRLKLGPFRVDRDRNTINICSFKTFPSMVVNKDWNKKDLDSILPILLNKNLSNNAMKNVSNKQFSKKGDLALNLKV